MNQPTSEKVFSILDALNHAEISYSLHINREEAITILAAVPGQLWEIDVFRNADVYVEVFSSNGHIGNESELDEMIERFAN